jgi:hypothetical protein
MMETGDPLAGTERNEVSAKNIGLCPPARRENWNVGSLEKFLLTWEGEYQEMVILLLKQDSIIPPFHYSMYDAGTHALRKLLFSISCRIPETFNRG